MATVFVTHHLYPDNPAVFVVDIQKVVTKRGERNTAFSANNRGEQFWKAVIYTSGLDSSEVALGPYWVDLIGTEQTFNDLINDKIEEICGLVDWSKSLAIDEDLQQQIDTYPPVVYWQYPTAGQVDVPIDSVISMRLRDLPPAKGIDISTLIFKVDGFTLNPTVTGNKYDYVLNYKPPFVKN